MDAQFLRGTIAALSLLCLGASYRTANFIVQAPTRQFAQTVCEAAEQYRKDLAIEWLDRPLPSWPQPCPITVQVGPRLGAGGATSFSFRQRQPFGWTMSIQGSAERILDSVLPHEVTHTIFATHFGRPLPRWADEGACTTVEHVSERTKQHHLLIEALTTRRGIAFNHMFAMKEYPADMLPLYAQGYSLARFLIAQRGKQQFVRYIGEGMQSGDWHRATRRHYHFNDLSELQVSWVDWVRRGSSPAEARIMLASRTNHSAPRDRTDDPGTVTPESTDSFDRQARGSLELASSTVSASNPRSPRDRLPEEKDVSWYSRQRHPTSSRDASGHAFSERKRNSRPSDDHSATFSRPQRPQRSQPRILEWDRPQVSTRFEATNSLSPNRFRSSPTRQPTFWR